MADGEHGRGGGGPGGREGPGPPDGGLDELVRLEVPLDGAYVGLVRGVVTSVLGALSDVDQERVEDVRLAVSEACTVVGAGTPVSDGVLALSCRVDGTWLRIEVVARGARPLPAPDVQPGYDQGWAPQLLEALVDRVEIERSPDRRAVVLELRRGTAA